MRVIKCDKRPKGHMGKDGFVYVLFSELPDDCAFCHKPANSHESYDPKRRGRYQ